MSGQEVLAIGGGLIALGTAYARTTGGERVRVVAVMDVLACGASYANGGLLTGSMSEPWNAPGAALHLAAAFLMMQRRFAAIVYNSSNAIDPLPFRRCAAIRLPRSRARGSQRRGKYGLMNRCAE